MWILGSDNLWMSPAPGLSPASSTPCQSIRKNELLIPKCAWIYISSTLSFRVQQHGQKSLSPWNTHRGPVWLLQRLWPARHDLPWAGRTPTAATLVHCLRPTQSLEWRSSFSSSIVSRRTLWTQTDTLFWNSYKSNRWSLPTWITEQLLNSDVKEYDNVKRSFNCGGRYWERSQEMLLKLGWSPQLLVGHTQNRDSHTPFHEGLLA